MNTPTIRPHPQGGHTLAVPVAGTATARLYVGQFATPAAARTAAQQLALGLGRIEAHGLLEKIRGGRAA